MRMRTRMLRALNVYRCVFVFMGLVLASALGTHAWAQLTTARLGGKEFCQLRRIEV